MVNEISLYYDARSKKHQIVYAGVHQCTLNMKVPTTSRAALISVQNCGRYMIRSAKPGFWALSSDQQKFRFDNFNGTEVVLNFPSVFRGGSFVPRDFANNFNQSGYRRSVLLQRLVNKRRKEPCRCLTNYINRRHICQQRHLQREITTRQQTVGPHVSSNESGYLSSIFTG